MSIPKEVWINLLENAPSACARVLHEVAVKVDLDSVEAAIEANVATTGRTNDVLRRASNLAHAFCADAPDRQSVSEEQTRRKEILLERYLSAVGNVTILDAILSEMVADEKRTGIRALVRNGASPYRHVTFPTVPGDAVQEGTRVRSVDQYLALGEMSAILLYKDLFGNEPITDLKQLPRSISIESGNSKFDCNLLEACILKGHHGAAKRIREQILPGPTSNDIYQQMGDLVRALLALPVTGVQNEKEAGSLKPLNDHDEVVLYALRLIGNGARMRAQEQWQDVLWREVGDQASPLFFALKPYQPEPHMSFHRLPQQEVCEIFSACLEAGLDVNKLNKHGGTFLIDAASQGNTRLVEILLLAGANTRPTISGPDGAYSALDFALEKDNETIIAMLRTAQARQAIMSVVGEVRRQPR